MTHYEDQQNLRFHPDYTEHIADTFAHESPQDLTLTDIIAAAKESARLSEPDDTSLPPVSAILRQAVAYNATLKPNAHSDLIAAAIDGDHQATANLVLAYVPAVIARMKKRHAESKDITPDRIEDVFHAGIQGVYDAILANVPASEFPNAVSWHIRTRVREAVESERANQNNRSLDAVSDDKLVTATMEDDIVTKMTVAELLERLTEKQKQVLILHYNLQGDGEHTFEIIGKTLGFTRERARKVEETALRHLRHAKVYEPPTHHAIVPEKQQVVEPKKSQAPQIIEPPTQPPSFVSTESQEQPQQTPRANLIEARMYASAATMVFLGAMTLALGSGLESYYASSEWISDPKAVVLGICAIAAAGLSGNFLSTSFDKTEERTIREAIAKLLNTSK